MTTMKDGRVYDLIVRNRPVEKSVIIEDLSDVSSIHSVGRGAKGITASNQYKRIVFVLSGKLECTNRSTGHVWTCPAGSFTVFSETGAAGIFGLEDTVALRIVVVKSTEIYQVLEDEKAYDIAELVPLDNDTITFVHILSCGNTRIWALTIPEGKSFGAEPLHADMLYLCVEGSLKITYDGKEYELHAKQAFCGLKDRQIRLESASPVTRVLVMKDIL
ncbi:MAG: hypothetical protein ACI32N_05160 [Bulleidia sp.]